MSGRAGSKVLNEKSFNLILTLKEAGVSNKQIMEITGVSHSSIWRVDSTKTWEGFKAYKDAETVKREAFRAKRAAEAAPLGVGMVTEQLSIDHLEGIDSSPESLARLLTSINEVLQSLDKRCEFLENNAILPPKKRFFQS